MELAFDSAGNLFESDSLSGNIYKFTPAGIRSTFASELDGATGGNMQLAFKGMSLPVPEPSVFAFLALAAVMPLVRKPHRTHS